LGILGYFCLGGLDSLAYLGSFGIFYSICEGIFTGTFSSGCLFDSASFGGVFSA